MALAATDVLGDRIVSGVAVGFRPDGNRTLPLEWIDGAHPVPDERSVQAAMRALEIASAVRNSGEELLVLLSGGASSMLAAPGERISLQDKRSVTESILRAGADIRQMNCVRKHLSAIKGGRLAIASGRCRTLAISDVHVPADDPGTIGSGPTVADETTYAEALQILDELRITVPRGVREHLERGAAGEIEETPKPGDGRLTASTFQVVANRRLAMDAAAREAVQRGYTVDVVDPPTGGEARLTGRRFAAAALAAPVGPPMCVIGSGETTVTVRGEGRGGRNQEFVLGAAAVLAEAPGLAVIGSAGTDGIDGPTDAAGGLASSTTLSRLRALGFDVDDVLARNDACPALERLGDLIMWGPTLTNVGDVHVVLTMRP